MNDFALLMTLSGLIAFSALFVYFFVWREPPRPPAERKRMPRRRRSGERFGERKEVTTR